MTIRANAELKFLRKYLFIAFACIAFGLYCLLDGIVLAPKKMPRSEAYAELEQDVADKTEKSKRWQEIVKERGWKNGIPEKTPKQLREYIVWQYVMASGCALVAVPLIIWYVRTKGSWIEGDEESVRGSWGPVVRFDSIEKIDKKKWEKKGIAKISYQTEGTSRQFVLDDFKYQRKPMAEIMKLIEAALTADQIVNDSAVAATTEAGGDVEKNS